MYDLFFVCYFLIYCHVYISNQTCGFIKNTFENTPSAPCSSRQICPNCYLSSTNTRVYLLKQLILEKKKKKQISDRDALALEIRALCKRFRSKKSNPFVFVAAQCQEQNNNCSSSFLPFHENDDDSVSFLNETNHELRCGSGRRVVASAGSFVPHQVRVPPISRTPPMPTRIMCHEHMHKSRAFKRAVYIWFFYRHRRHWHDRTERVRGIEYKSRNYCPSRKRRRAYIYIQNARLIKSAII